MSPYLAPEKRAMGQRVNDDADPSPFGWFWHCSLCDLWGTRGRAAFESHYTDHHLAACHG